MRNGERAQQDRVEDTENGGIGTDPQSKSEDGDQGETCVFCEHARGEANVLPDGLESGESPQLAASLSGEHGVANWRRAAYRASSGSMPSARYFSSRLAR